MTNLVVTVLPEPDSPETRMLWLMQRRAVLTATAELAEHDMPLLTLVSDADTPDQSSNARIMLRKAVSAMAYTCGGRVPVCSFSAASKYLRCTASP